MAKLKLGDKAIVKKGKHTGKVVKITLVLEDGKHTNYHARLYGVPVEMFFREEDLT